MGNGLITDVVGLFFRVIIQKYNCSNIGNEQYITITGMAMLLSLSLLLLTMATIGVHGGVGECEAIYGGESTTFTSENGAYECSLAFGVESDCVDNCIACVWVCSADENKKAGTFSVDAHSFAHSCDCHTPEHSSAVEPPSPSTAAAAAVMFVCFVPFVIDALGVNRL